MLCTVVFLRPLGLRLRGALRIALEGTYPPFNFKQGGKLTGFETELGE
ncbi:ABC transporter substrate-binding protein, partial [Pseudomonas aeruginosa]|nr:ABC transporter substrate-binding protein [Pseudomonas aeruginosa]